MSDPRFRQRFQRADVPSFETTTRRHALPALAPPATAVPSPVRPSCLSVQGGAWKTWLAHAESHERQSRAAQAAELERLALMGRLANAD